MTEYFDSIAKRIANILLTLAVSFALFACADIGERDNPVDPGYKGARVEELSSSSSWSLDVSSSSSWSLAIGSMTDSRDGQVYKTVTIGTQTWMAENLNYDPGDVSGMGSYAWSGCYDNQRKICSKYGRLYTWEVAMNNAACGIGMTCDPSGVVQGVCPEGWHLPSIDEWNALFTAVGGISTAGTMLKSTSGWSSNGNGTGAFGFSALPAGDRDDNGNFDSMGYYAFFWSSTERYGDYAYYMDLYYHYESAFLDLIYKYDAFSVRCLRD